MYYLFTFCILMCCVTLSAQSSLQKRAVNLYDKGKCVKSAALYKKLYDANKDNSTIALGLAKALWCSGDKSSAESVLNLLTVKSTATAEVFLYYAELLRSNGNYTEAEKMYKEFARLAPNDIRAQAFSQLADQVKPMLQPSGGYELTSIPENSAASDIGPALSYGGTLSFCSNRNKATIRNYNTAPPRKKQYNLFAIAGTKTELAEPVLLRGKVNSKWNDGTATFSRDGKEIIFSRTNTKISTSSGKRNIGLYTAEWSEKRGWINVLLLPFVSAQYNYLNPTLSKDGQLLFFASDMTGGFGETDIYVCFRMGNVWGAPQNLGKQINTPGKELFPFIADDGTLYFSTDARVGLGGLDIFSATYHNNQYGNVQNLGAPVNSTANDFGYLSDETLYNGYITSDRSGGLGSDDIYRFVRKAEKICGTVVNEKDDTPIADATVVANLPNGAGTQSKTNEKGEYCVIVLYGVHQIVVVKDGFHKTEGILQVTAAKSNRSNSYKLKPKGDIELTVDVSEKNTGKLEGATAFLVDKQSGEIIQAKTDLNGIAKFELDKNKEYVVKVAKNSTTDGLYDRFVKTISTVGFHSGTMQESAQLTYYKKEAVFQLPNVYFDLNSFELKLPAKNDLDKLAESMLKFPDVEIEISAHTDSRGNDEYNMLLSAKRANACVQYLSAKGVNIKKIIAVGFGELKILNKCKNKVPCTDAEHAVNRRIEFKVAKFD